MPRFAWLMAKVTSTSSQRCNRLMSQKIVPASSVLYPPLKNLESIMWQRRVLQSITDEFPLEEIVRFGFQILCQSPYELSIPNNKQVFQDIPDNYDNVVIP